MFSKYYTACLAILLATNILSAQNKTQNKKDTIVLSVYNTNQRFMLYPAPFGTAIGNARLLTDLVAAYDTVAIKKVSTAKDTSAKKAPNKINWVISTERGCNKIEGDVKGKVAIILQNPACDISRQMYLAQSKGAKAVIIIHNTNSKDTVWLDTKKEYEYAEKITIPCHTVRNEMGVKISQMLPSLVGIAKKDTSTIPIQALQTYADSVRTDALNASQATRDAFNASIQASLQAQQGWVLAPNPADDEVTVLFNFTSPQNATLQVSNNVGDVVNLQKRESVQSGTFSIDVSAFPTGVYNINLQHGRFLETKRLLVTH